MPILNVADILPPLPDAVAGKLAGVVAGAQVEISGIAFEIVQAMRDDDAGAEAGKIVIVNLLGLLNVEFPIAIEQVKRNFGALILHHKRSDASAVRAFKRTGKEIALHPRRLFIGMLFDELGLFLPSVFDEFL